jgi:hypothetical protein
MHKVTDEQIDFILDDIAKRGIETEDVRYNILDHVCCIIENEMPAGQDFFEFYRNTIARFYKDELREIEEETRELITFKYFYAMKRTLKITGAVTIILCLLGSLFKFMHWPGAGIMLVLSLGFFALVFIPLNIIMKFKDEKEKTNKLLITFGFILGMSMTMGMLFKIFHWPFANILMFGSLGIFALIYVPLYFFTRYRNAETKFNAIVNTTFMIAGSGLLFGMVNLKNSQQYEMSLMAMDQYQEDNADKMEMSNTKLYEELASKAEINEIRTLTSELQEVLRGIKIRLISKSEKISEEKAAEFKISDLSNRNDFKVVKNHFVMARDQYSKEGLESAIRNYNEGIAILNQPDVLRVIDIESLHMEHTTVSVILNELNDIEVQLLSNENSYLSLQKGLIASK